MTLSPDDVRRLVDAVLAELRRRGPVEPLALGEPAAARLLGVSPRTLYSMRQAGTIPHTTIGTRIVYPLDVLRGWLADRAQPAAVPPENDVARVASGRRP